jgi:hypothetical protein
MNIFTSTISMNRLTKRLVPALLVALILMGQLVAMTSTVTAQSDTLVWNAPSGGGQTMGAIDWTSRLSFRSPLALLDSTSGIEYRTSSDIFGNGTSSYLNDGGDNNAWYIYVPVGDNKEPVANPNTGCFGVIAVELADDGSDMWLKAIQPERSSDGTECVFGGRDAVQGRVSGGIGDPERARMFDIGSGGQEIDGRSNQWRLLVAPFFWANQNEIRGFDSSQAPFTPLAGSDLDAARTAWEGTSASGAPPDSARTTSGWRFFKSADCSDETLAVNPANTDLYIFRERNGIETIIDAQTSGFSQCALGRNLDGGSTGLINAVGRPSALALVENASLTAEQVNQDEFAGSGNPIDPATEEDLTNPEPTCFTAGGFLSWILCPVLTVLDESTQFLERQIQGFLFIDQEQFSRDGPLYQSWSSFRGIATVIIIIIAAIMIFSQAMGEGIFDNYSVKKLLPRLIFAGIGIQLSWFAMVLLIDIFNVLGDGIAGLMLSPFDTPNGVALNADTNLRDLMGDMFRTASGGDFFTGLASVTIGGVALVGAFVALAIGAAAALFIAFITLIIRNMVILLGVVFSPIAIAMSVLPGTQKTSKWWWESFEKALLMYPLVMAVLSIGKILAVLLLGAAQSDDDEGIKMTYVMAAAVAWYGPFALLGKLGSIGGQALGKIGGLAGDKSKGMFDKARGWNDNYKKTKDARQLRTAFTADRAKFDPRRLTDAKTKGGAYLAAGAIGRGTSVDRANLRVQNAQQASNRRNFNEQAALAEMELKESETKTNQAASEMALAQGKVTVSVNGVDTKFDMGQKDHVLAYLKSAPQGAAGDAQRTAALKQLATLGGDEQIRSIRDDTTQEGADARRVLSENLTSQWYQAAFKDKAGDLTKGGMANAFKAGEMPDGAGYKGMSPDTMRRLFTEHPDPNVGKQYLNDLISKASKDPDFASSLDGKQLNAIQASIDTIHAGSGGTGPAPIQIRDVLAKKQTG